MALAHNKGISVEAELGTIAGSEDGIVNSEVIYADPEECYTTVTETQVDCLAAALGSTHGLYKGKARLGFTEMKAIAERVKVPLVLHGGTGIADEDMRRAIACGTAKINVNTENMYARCQQVKAIFAADTGHDVNDPRKVITRGLQPVREMIARRMALLAHSSAIDAGPAAETSAPKLPGRRRQGIRRQSRSSPARPRKLAHRRPESTTCAQYHVGGRERRSCRSTGASAPWRRF